MSGIFLSHAQRTRLRSCTVHEGVERIDGVPGLNEALSRDDDSFELTDDLVATAKSLAQLGLSRELEHINNLCKSGFVGEASQRIRSPFGLEGIIQVVDALAINDREAAAG